MNTLLLDTARWDLLLDNQGNIAMATNPYAMAQDAASAIRLFQGELWYDNSKGLPYWQQVLGMYPPLSLMQSLIEGAAMEVPGVIAANAILKGYRDRQLTGEVHVTDNYGATVKAGF